MVGVSITGMITTPKEVAGMTWEEWQAFLQMVQDCTCSEYPNHYGMTCDSCREYQRKRYGDNIPFGGE